jgi:hypothetical protein
MAEVDVSSYRDNILQNPLDMSNKLLENQQKQQAVQANSIKLATELEARASKMVSYVGEWERSTPEQQNRSMILALADRLDRLEST